MRYLLDKAKARILDIIKSTAKDIAPMDDRMSELLEQVRVYTLNLNRTNYIVCDAPYDIPQLNFKLDNNYRILELDDVDHKLIEWLWPLRYTMNIVANDLNFGEPPLSNYALRILLTDEEVERRQDVTTEQFKAWKLSGIPPIDEEKGE